MCVGDDVVPFSGGSSLEGNFSAPFGGISVDFTDMDQILDLHEDECVTSLEHGVKKGQLTLPM